MARRTQPRHWPTPVANEVLPAGTPARSGAGKARSQNPHSTRSPVHRSTSAPGHAAAFGCLLIPQFPIWAARITTPSSADRPLLIHRGGKVIAACPKCRKNGVRVGWILSRAQALCPQALVNAFNPAEIGYAWETVLTAFYGLTPQLESPRPGLLFFSPPATSSTNWLPFMAALAKLAREWKAQVVVAPDRSTTEIAAYVGEPGTVRRIQPGQEQGFLSEVSCNVLTRLGLSEDTAQKLEWFGFRSLTDLQVLTHEQIASQFAERGAQHEVRLLWRCAQAGTPEADRRPVQSYQLPPVCKARIALEQAASCPREWNAALWEAVQQASAQLNGMSAGAVTLSLVLKSGQHTRSKLLRENISSPRMLLRHVHDLIQSAVGADDEVQIVEVTLSRLVASGVQTSLFDGLRGINLPRPECPPCLLRALRNVEVRYTGTLWRWLLRDEHAPLPEERFARIPLRECAEDSETR